MSEVKKSIWRKPPFSLVKIQRRTQGIIYLHSWVWVEKYVALPALVGRSRIRSFQNIQDRIWSRINGWKERFLSQARKEVLLKVAIQAIPTYMMIVFQLPNALCKRINSMMTSFW